jgi:hypothetical protein
MRTSMGREVQVLDASAAYRRGVMETGWLVATRRSWAAAVCAGIMTLGGCIPAPVGTYYQPQMDVADATYSGSECHGQSGAPAVLHATLAPGVTVRIDAMRIHGAPAGPGRPLHIDLTVPLHTTLQFQGRVVRISRDEGRTWSDVPLRVTVSARVAVPGPVVMARVAPTDLAAIESKTFRATAFLDYTLPRAVPQRLTMTVPAIRLGSGVVVPATRVVAQSQDRPESYKGEYRDHRSLIYTTENSRVRLAQRAADCQRRVAAGERGLHCDNLRLYDLGGFEASAGPLAMSGRWSVFNVEGGTPLDGELRIETRQPLDWSFVDDAIRIDDEQGHTFTVPTRTMTLGFHYDLVLDAAVRGVSDAPLSQPTSVSLLGDLGTDESAQLRIQLPPLRVNGATVVLPPIDLIRHTLEFELAPFNC